MKRLQVETTTRLQQVSEAISTRFITYTTLLASLAIISATIFTVTALPTFIQTSAVIIPSVLSQDETNSVRLTWTAPGDDLNVGTATRYDLRYSTSAIDDSNWASATSVADPPAPALAGMAESFLVTNLTPSTTYYFAVKSYDEADNESPLSNIATQTTGCNELWSCSAWTTCANDQQSRTCVDLNDCGTTADQPDLTQVCTEEPEPVAPCSESWSCTDWSSCTDGEQTRACTDRNRCGTTAQKPAETQACQAEEPAECTESWSCTDWSACSEGRQTRTCTDANGCGSQTTKPGAIQDCAVGGEEPQVFQDSYVVTAPNQGGGPHIRVFNKEGKFISQFFAYEQTFKGGLNLAAGDLVGNDGIDEIVVGPGPGREPLVKIFSHQGELLGQFYALSKEFRGGINVAVGELNEQPGLEIVVAPASRGGPQIRIFGQRNDQYVSVIPSFWAYTQRFRGEVSLAIADLNGNGKFEILTVPGERSGGPHVRFFEYVDGRFVTHTLGFFAYPTTFRGGVSLAAGHFTNQVYGEIITAPVTAGGPHVRFFGSRRDKTIGLTSAGWFAFEPEFRGGLSLATGDFNYDTLDEVVTAVRSNGQARVRIYSSNGKTILYQFTAYLPEIQTGVKITTGHFTPPR